MVDLADTAKREPIIMVVAQTVIFVVAFYVQIVYVIVAATACAVRI
jgi:hypothetical protein